MDVTTFTVFFSKYGALAIFLIVLLEYLNLPGFPAGVIMPLSGVMAAKGNISFFWVMIITVLAGLTGSLLLYMVGKIGGQVFLKAYIRRFPKQEGAIQNAIVWVQKKGCIGVFAAKLLPMVRTIISIPAGALQMPLGKYIVSSTLGIIIWNFVFVGAGYLMGEKVFSLFNSL